MTKSTRPANAPRRRRFAPMSVIACGSYNNGHDSHFIAAKVTFSWKGHECDIEVNGTEVRLHPHRLGGTGAGRGGLRIYNHRPDVLARIAGQAESATLLRVDHLVWFHIVEPSSPTGYGHALVNIDWRPVVGCDAAASMPDDGDYLDGGN